jgi:hypothetical protein
LAAAWVLSAGAILTFAGSNSSWAASLWQRPQSTFPGAG